MMDTELDIALREMEVLTKQADAGKIDTERWRDCVTFLGLIGCDAFAESMDDSLRVYEQAAIIVNVP